MAEIKLKLSHRALLLVAALLCLNIAVAAYNQAIQFVNSGDKTILLKSAQASSFDFVLSPFTNQRMESLNDVAEQLTETNKRLEFMVWPTERAQLQKQLAKLYQQRINAVPFRGQFWIEMLNSQAWYSATKEERFWMLDKTARLLKWDLANSYLLARPCAQDFENLIAFSSTLCPELFSKLPYKKRFKYTALQMGVSLERFNEVLVKSELLDSGPQNLKFLNPKIKTGHSR